MSLEFDLNFKQHNMFIKSARYLLLNSPDDLTDLQSVLTTIVQNILSNPSDSKYRFIKLSNKIVQNKIINRKGGIEFLGGAGFDIITKDGEKALFLSPNEREYNKDSNLDNSSLTTSVVNHLIQSLQWLNDNVVICLEYAALRSFPSSSFASISTAAAKASPCAECIIQIKLPLANATSVSGGFGKSEPVEQVAAFAQSFFTQAKAQEGIFLRFAHDASIVDTIGESGSRSIEEAGLFPRAVLLATIQSDSDRQASLHMTKQAVATEVKQSAVNAQQLKQTKLAQIEDRKKEKQAILNSFLEDRENRKYRASFATESASVSASFMPVVDSDDVFKGEENN